MTKHTPGPWEKSDRLNGPWWHISAQASGVGPGQGRQAIAAVHGESKRGALAYPEMFEANARLIAAAPDLLYAVQRLLLAHYSDGITYSSDHPAAEARRAVAKAQDAV